MQRCELCHPQSSRHSRSEIMNPGSAAASVGASTPLPSTVLISKYGKTFFDESGSGKVLMSFDNQGNGFANHPSGHPAVTTTEVGGCICDADTDIVDQWVWRKRDGPRTPFEMRVGTSYTLILRGRHDCEVICGNGARVQVLRAASREAPSACRRVYAIDATRFFCRSASPAARRTARTWIASPSVGRAGAS